MRKLLLVLTLIVVNLATDFAQQRTGAQTTKGVIVAFYDEERLRRSADGQAELEGFAFFFRQIRDIAKRDFPGVEFRVLKRGEFFRLSDSTGLNVQNMQPALGYVLSVRGKKHRVLSGPQSEEDFSCAAAAFFARSSSSCHK